MCLAKRLMMSWRGILRTVMRHHPGQIFKRRRVGIGHRIIPAGEFLSGYRHHPGLFASRINALTRASLRPASADGSRLLELGCASDTHRAGDHGALMRRPVPGMMWVLDKALFRQPVAKPRPAENSECVIGINYINNLISETNRLGTGCPNPCCESRWPRRLEGTVMRRPLTFARSSAVPGS